MYFSSCLVITMDYSVNNEFYAKNTHYFNKPELKSKFKQDPNLRPTFYYKDIYPIRAGGVLLYRMVLNDIFILMINNNGIYEDIGGKTDTLDKTYNDTIRREVMEESNNIININKFDNPIYFAKSKYIMYIMQTNENYDCNIFGNIELFNSMKRTFEWVHINDIKNNKIKLHPRLEKWFLQYIKKN